MKEFIENIKRQLLCKSDASLASLYGSNRDVIARFKAGKHTQISNALKITNILIKEVPEEKRLDCLKKIHALSKANVKIR